MRCRPCCFKRFAFIAKRLLGVTVLFRRGIRFGRNPGLAGSASLGLTMMACYGCPPGECREPPDASGDATGADGGQP